MSAIDLETAKALLDVTHGFDDVKLQVLLDGAEAEAAGYMNRPDLRGPWDAEGDSNSPPSSEPAVPGDVVLGVMLLMQAVYQAPPDDVPKLRAAAEVKLSPRRLGMGV